MPSFSRAQALRFAEQGARERREVNADPAQPALFEGKRLCVSRSGVEHQRSIEAGGFEHEPDLVVRVDAAAYPWFLPTEAAAKAALGKTLTIEGLAYLITSAKRIPGEIVLGLGKA